MLPTPDLSHLTKKDLEEVYEPAEDTFLLLDALEVDYDYLKGSKPSICLEIGSGSGCVTSFLGNIIGSTAYFCTDINPHACRCTQRTGKQNNVNIQVIHGSLASPLELRLASKVDVLLFNPPYVPTSDDEVGHAQSDGKIEGAWAGGSGGMQITNVMLSKVKNLLSPSGRFYLVALKENNVPGIIKLMREMYTLTGEIVLQRHAGREHLFILRFSHL
ncbi:S-adenosyl-L-methionine-dependent methyltransferase [Crepidotus variabilis]|uniref:S-adenosyl-L-methionine-dependent methyltransferase n=1 Tax=Crepidotus variabilis TaxID=179855 RepID=A0A9P6EVF6_9AGAR|nr:S-adenosyl-L-methionine-dependent methyltransferase [Crepidotus variabilis]